MKAPKESSSEGVVFDEPLELIEKLVKGTRYHLEAGKTVTDDSALKYAKCFIRYEGEVVHDISKFIGTLLYEEG